MRPLCDADRLARATGGLVGLGLVIAAALPFNGVPPRGGSGTVAPAQVEVRVLPSGELQIDPTGTVLEPTAFPAPGQPGGPSLAVTVRNITGVPLKLSVRLASIAPALDTAAKVRGSVAGAVVLNGPLGKAAEWSRPAGVLQSGQSSTLRMRFKLLPGTPADAWGGRLDVRQLEIKGVRVVPIGTTPAGVFQTTPGIAPSTPDATTPADVPPGSTPPAATTPPAGSTPSTP